MKVNLSRILSCFHVLSSRSHAPAWERITPFVIILVITLFTANPALSYVPDDLDFAPMGDGAHLHKLSAYRKTQVTMLLTLQESLITLLRLNSINI
ncbi:MAG: hypothetical protein JRD93_17760 [Deltaproteobacteria bacterium]|nr:hypothetical protein [Deltaproteobacteria bacterium]